jgi:hypothetical protein
MLSLPFGRRPALVVPEGFRRRLRRTVGYLRVRWTSWTASSGFIAPDMTP